MLANLLKKRRISLRKLLLIIVIFGLVYWLVLSPILNRMILQYRLGDATAKWQASGIEHYRIVFDVGIPLAMNANFAVVVKNGQIEEASWMPMLNFYANLPNTDAYAPVTDDQIDLYRASRYTVEGIYEFAISTLNPPDTMMWYNFEFDPQYHYISRGDGGCYGAIGDCGFYYRVIEFEPLTDE